MKIREIIRSLYFGKNPYQLNEGGFKAMSACEEEKPSLDQIIEDLEQFCKERGIILCADSYDALQVWDIVEGTPALHFNGIEDKRESAHPGAPLGNPAVTN